MAEAYTENEFFVFTFSRHQNIIDLFESTKLYYKEDNLTACGSSFATKSEALDFAYKIERLKRKFDENEFIVKRSLSPYWIHDLFTRQPVTPVNWGGALVGIIN